MSAKLQASSRSPWDGVIKPHPKILVVDRDSTTWRMLRAALENRYNLHWTATGAAALKEAVEFRPDVIVLELDLPDLTGCDVLTVLREWSDTPVLILTAQVLIAERVRLLDAGANDYVIKPFAPEELAARLRVLLRREVPRGEGPLLETGPLKFDLATREGRLNGELLELTEIEEALLYILVRHAGKTVPCRRLLRAIWGREEAGKMQALMVHIARLRGKFGVHQARELITGHGDLGYSLVLQ